MKFLPSVGLYWSIPGSASFSKYVIILLSERSNALRESNVREHKSVTAVVFFQMQLSSSKQDSLKCSVFVRSSV